MSADQGSLPAQNQDELLENLAEDGGPAFPVNVTDADGGRAVGHWGMTLRDWFAGLAMQGFIAAQSDSDNRMALKEKAITMGIGWFELISKDAYATADAMLSKRECAREVRND